MFGATYLYLEAARVDRGGASACRALADLMRLLRPSAAKSRQQGQPKKRPEPCESEALEQHPVLLPGDPEPRNRECVGAVGEDAETLARLQKTVTALAHVHAILVRLHARVADVGDADSGKK